MPNSCEMMKVNKKLWKITNLNENDAKLLKFNYTFKKKLLNITKKNN
jgi:hypothetical protein